VRHRLQLMALLAAVAAAPAFAQGEDGDSGLARPDAGPVNPGNEEEEESVGKTPTVCRNSNDCERGFTCDNGKCAYVGYRKADRVGCLAGAQGSLVLVGFAFATRRRIRSRKSRITF
jgi:hypothetical protein